MEMKLLLFCNRSFDYADSSNYAKLTFASLTVQNIKVTLDLNLPAEIKSGKMNLGNNLCIPLTINTADISFVLLLWS